MLLEDGDGMDCQDLEASIISELSHWTRVLPLGSGECLIRLPLWDGMGDPIELTVSVEGGRATIGDAGSIAALLFSLGQDAQSTPAFKLVEKLKGAHGLELDFDEGLVKLSVAGDSLYEGISEMAKVVMTLHTVVPHIRVAQRGPASFGPRLRSRIAREYEKLHILDLVDRSFLIDGATVSGWPVDFHWSVGSNGSSYSVNVIAADLGVSEPLVKANRIVALSMDTRAQLSSAESLLRVAIESQDSNAQSGEAGDFLRYHSGSLDYRVFDLRDQDEYSAFFTLSVNELARDAPKPWVEFLSSRSGQ